MNDSRRLDSKQRMKQCAFGFIRASGAVGNVRNGLHSMKDIVTVLFGSAPPTDRYKANSFKTL